MSRLTNGICRVCGKTTSDIVEWPEYCGVDYRGGRVFLNTPYEGLWEVCSTACARVLAKDHPYFAEIVQELEGSRR